jgi:endonuclease G
MQAYLIPNEHAQGKSFKTFKTTVRAIENLTGIDFFSELPDDLETLLETHM